MLGGCWGKLLLPLEKAHPGCSLSLGLLWHCHWLFITQGRWLGWEEYCSPLCKLLISQSWFQMRQAMGSRWGRSMPCPGVKALVVGPASEFSVLPHLSQGPHTSPSADSQTMAGLSWDQIPRLWFLHAFLFFSLSRIWGQLTSHISIITDSTLYSRLVIGAEELASLLLSTSRSRSGALPLLTLAPAFQRLRHAGLLQRTSGSAIWGG